MWYDNFLIKILDFWVWSRWKFEWHFLLIGASDRWLREVKDVISDGLNLFDEIILKCALGVFDWHVGKHSWLKVWDREMGFDSGVKATWILKSEIEDKGGLIIDFCRL